MYDRVMTGVLFATFVTVVFFAGMSKGQSSVKQTAEQQLTQTTGSLMTVSECLGIIGKNIK